MKYFTILLIISLFAFTLATSNIEIIFSQSSTNPNTNSNGIQIIQSSSFIDSNGFFHVVGELKNNNPVPVTVNVTSTLYNSSNTPLGKDSAHTLLDVVRPNEISPFEIIIFNSNVSPNIAKYSLDVVAEQANPKPSALLMNINSSYVNSSGHFHITGKITNQANTDATDVIVTGSFYSNNTIVEASVTQPTPPDIPPEQSAVFDINVKGPSENKINNFTLNAQSQQYAISTESTSFGTFSGNPAANEDDSEDATAVSNDDDEEEEVVEEEANNDDDSESNEESNGEDGQIEGNGEGESLGNDCPEGQYKNEDNECYTPPEEGCPEGTYMEEDGTCQPQEEGGQDACELDPDLPQCSEDNQNSNDEDDTSNTNSNEDSGNSIEEEQEETSE